MKTKRIAKNRKSYKFFLIRKKYQEKRRRKSWKQRKKIKLAIKRAIARHSEAPYISIEAPKDFSFIENTNDVLKYFENARDIYWSKKNVDYNVLEIERITAETVSLWVALLKEPRFRKTGNSSGNAPKNKEAYDLLSTSGFPDQVTKSNFEKKEHNNLLHREVNYKVQSSIAARFCQVGINNTNKKRIDAEPLYNVLIECMSNTHDHANLDQKGGCRWQLYAYNVPNQAKTIYTFLDLGVGIFESAGTQNYINNFLKTVGVRSNLDLVDPLLNGKIKSRMIKDKDIRGKGIQQLVKYAEQGCFNNFYLISNNIKVNLGTGQREKLDYNLRGTMLYWELI